MSGVYFVVRPHLQECYIGYSHHCTKDTKLLSDILYDQNHEIHIIKTRDLVSAEEVHLRILEYININYVNSQISGNWYQISSVDIGSIKEKAINYHNMFYFTKINGKIKKLVLTDNIKKYIQNVIQTDDLKDNKNKSLQSIKKRKTSVD